MTTEYEFEYEKQKTNRIYESIFESQTNNEKKTFHSIHTHIFCLHTSGKPHHIFKVFHILQIGVELQIFVVFFCSYSEPQEIPT